MEINKYRLASLFIFILTISALLLPRAACSVSAPAQPLKLKLTLTERADNARINEPITSGVPLPEGAIFADKKTNLLPLKLTGSKGQIIPAQFKQLAPWPDGSCRWVLIDFQADMEAGSKEDYFLERTTEPAGPVSSSLKVIDQGDNIAVDTGAIEFSVNKKKFNIFNSLSIKRANSSPYKIIDSTEKEGILLFDKADKKYYASLSEPKEIKVEELNSQRAVILIRGKYKDDSNTVFEPKAAEYTVRIYAYDKKDYVRVFFTLENNGRYGFRHEDNVSDSFLFNALSLSFPLSMGNSAQLSTQDYGGAFTSQDSFYLYQRHSVLNPDSEEKNFQFFIKHNEKQVKNGARTDGWVDLRGDDAGCTVAVRHFWQNYPKAVEVKNNKLIVHLWPKGEKWPPDAKASYFMRGGTHKTYEILMRFYDPSANKKLTAQKLLKSFNSPILALPSPEWFQKCQAPGWIAPAGIQNDDKEIDEALKRYEKLQKCKVNVADSEIQYEEIPASTVITEREGRGEGMDWYGWMDFGDLAWGGETGGGAYATGHYDWPYGMLLNFIRTQDYAFFDLGEEMTRHRIDIDQYHSKTGSPWLANFQWNEFGLHERSPEPWEPNPSHTWIKGVVLNYYLTGNPKCREVALAVGEATTYYWTHDFGDVRPGSDELRIQGWSIENLLELYKLTGNKKYLDLAIHVYKERTVPFIAPEGYCGNPQEINIYQLVLVLEPLIELDLFINNENLKDDIIRILHFLMTRAYGGGKIHKDKEGKTVYQQHYLPFYMNAQTGFKTASAPGYNFMISNALAYAYWITGNKYFQKMSNKLFKDAVFYWQEDPVYIDPQLRSPIAYSAAHFPGSRSKVHGWINRYPQVYLYVMGHPKTDSIPPSQITDLEAFEQDDKIFLDWSAPGDNKNEGIAARYQIKYSTKNISSELDWLQADHVEGEPAPDKYAGIQKFVIERLKPGKTYYFAIRTYDKENNQSAISNAAAVKLE